MTETPPPGDAESQSAALSQELSELLLELAIGVHRFAMYPLGHPSLLPATENLIRSLDEIFMGRKSISIGVAREQLVIEGIATESKHPVLRELARRLHGHHLGAISFSAGVMVSELEGILKLLALDPEREGDPLGLLPSDEIPTWEHAQVYPLGFGQLELKDGGDGGEEEPERATHLWLGLARAAIATDNPEAVTSSTGAETVADSIKSHRREVAYDQVIVGHLLQLADELRSGEGGESEAVRKRVSTLIRELDEPTLQRLVGMGGSLEQRKRFVLDANQSLAVDSVMKILQAAADASSQHISHSLTRLLSKLSLHASAGTARVRDQADLALRDNVEELINDWELEGSTPDAYTLILDSIANAAPVFHEEMDDDETPLTGAHRLVQMSMEMDAWGPTVTKAVSDLIDEGEVSFLVQIAEDAPEDSEAAERVRDHLTDPSLLRSLVGGSDVDEATLGFVVQLMGEPAISILLDGLTESESRSVRRKVFDVLAQIGGGVGKRIVPRLEESRWHVIRNLLALVQRIPDRPVGFSAAPFMAHSDPRVRREAFPLALLEPAHRHRTLASGLADPDERLLRMALLELRESVPETLVPILVNRVIRAEQPADLKAMGIRALRSSSSSLALETLIEVSGSGKTLLGRRKLAPTSPEMLAALHALHASWSDDPKARELLNVALKSKNPEIRNAVSSTGRDG